MAAKANSAGAGVANIGGAGPAGAGAANVGNAGSGDAGAGGGAPMVGTFVDMCHANLSLETAPAVPGENKRRLLHWR